MDNNSGVREAGITNVPRLTDQCTLYTADPGAKNRRSVAASPVRCALILRGITSSYADHVVRRGGFFLAAGSRLALTYSVWPSGDSARLFGWVGVLMVFSTL